jgi:hypothetical protein
MSVKFYVALCVLVSSALFIALAFAQTTAPINGHWAMGGIVPDRAQVTIQCCAGTGFNMTRSQSVPLDQLRGITRSQLEGSGAVTQFQIVRDAGTLQIQGYLQNGRGGGTFTFVPNPAFANEMGSLGYSGLSTEKILQLVAHDVGPASVREINTLGIHPQSTDQLVSMGIHGITPEFIRKTRARGLGNLSLDQLMSVKIHGILN